MIYLTDDQFHRLFTDFEHTAYRLQAQETYPMAPEDRERFPRWLATRHAEDDADWSALIRRQTGAGKIMRRVRVVSEPPSDRSRYSLAVHRFSVDAGEEIRYLARDAVEGLPTWDYWLFDSSRLYRMHHSETEPMRVEQVDDPATIVDANRWRDVAWHLATPYEAYAEAVAT